MREVGREKNIFLTDREIDNGIETDRLTRQRHKETA
jgi:hypothetical protein